MYFISQRSWKKLYWYGKYRPDIGHCRHCVPIVESLLKTSHLHVEKNSSVGDSGYSKERGVWGKYKVINCGWAWNCDSLSALARNSGPILLILLWGPSKSHSVGGGLKITFIEGWSGPQRTSFWVPLNRWALKLSSISWPASSKNMNGFSSSITL